MNEYLCLHFVHVSHGHCIRLPIRVAVAILCSYLIISVIVAQVLPLVPPGRKSNEDGSPYSGQVIFLSFLDDVSFVFDVL